MAKSPASRKASAHKKATSHKPTSRTLGTGMAAKAGRTLANTRKRQMKKLGI